MKTCSVEHNKTNCNCSFGCSRSGVCCECISYHRSLRELPACYFPSDAEPRGDRSVTSFIRIVNQRGTGFLG